MHNSGFVLEIRAPALKIAGSDFIKRIKQNESRELLGLKIDNKVIYWKVHHERNF